MQNTVLPDRKEAAEKERERNKEALADNPKAKVNQHHANFLKSWWQLSYPRENMISAIAGLKRYIACGRVTARPIFEFISSEIHPNDALVIFPFEDDYSFGILQSSIHWKWFANRCSTLKGDPRYTSNTVFDSFVWPQFPSLKAVNSVATAAKDLRDLRNEMKCKHEISLRELYRSLELPGSSPIKDAQDKLDRAVRGVYGIKQSEDVLSFLLELNQEVANKEDAGEAVIGPGLPSVISNKYKFVTNDCIHMPTQAGIGSSTKSDAGAKEQAR